MAEHITISNDQDQQRLDRLIRQICPSLSFGQTQKLIRSGQVRLDGKRAKADTRVTQGQVMRLPPNARQKAKPIQSITPKLLSEIKQMIVFEDEHLLVLNKPSGLASQGGSGIKQNLDDMLRDYCDPRPRLVHRLDKDTSGLMVLAKSAEAARRLGHAFQNKGVQKTYWAICCGTPQQNDGLIDAPIRKSGPAGQEKMVHDPENGQKAHTEFEVIDVMGDSASWIEFSPLTGRTHQIRIHAALIGCPLLGDRKYNNLPHQLVELDIYDGLHLHAAKLTMPHPMDSKNTLSFQAPLPKTLIKTWHSLGFDVSRN